MSRAALALLLGLSLSCTSLAQRDAETAAQLLPHAHPVVGSSDDYDALLDAIGDASLVLLGGSIDQVVSQLRRVDEAAADEAEKRYRWFTPSDRDDPLTYGRAAAQRTSRSCAMAASAQLEAVRAMRSQTTDALELDLLFDAEQNARVVRSAEEYFREEARGVVSTWNLRDRHMAATLAAVQKELARQGGGDRIAVWAHNSHIGDARATQRAGIGEWSLGQLVREHWDRTRSFSVGLMTDTGKVIAATHWNGRPEVKELRPSIGGSHGALLHAVGLPSFYLILAGIEAPVANEPRPQRFIGAIYRPEDERRSHYVRARLREQFDAVIHLDTTTGVEPLD